MTVEEPRGRRRLQPWCDRLLPWLGSLATRTAAIAPQLQLYRSLPEFVPSVCPLQLQPERVGCGRPEDAAPLLAQLFRGD